MPTLACLLVCTESSAKCGESSNRPAHRDLCSFMHNVKRLKIALHFTTAVKSSPSVLAQHAFAQWLRLQAHQPAPRSRLSKAIELPLQLPMNGWNSLGLMRRRDEYRAIAQVNVSRTLRRVFTTGRSFDVTHMECASHLQVDSTIIMGTRKLVPNWHATMSVQSTFYSILGLHFLHT